MAMIGEVADAKNAAAVVNDVTIIDDAACDITSLINLVLSCTSSSPLPEAKEKKRPKYTCMLH